MSNFVISSGKGFQLTFANGWTVSVQWGPGNYCDIPDHGGRWGAAFDAPVKAAAVSGGGLWKGESAEIAVIRPERAGDSDSPTSNFVSLGHDTVAGYLSSDAVARVIAAAVQLKAGTSDKEASELISEAMKNPD